ncbi:hypothetical protein EIP91_011276 [Steccherinum ochraceum]|uniref:Uncharacterized protein n=1 Tax=Steccherinum ochraceum TaxID=92696 RepID=A0A4V2MUU0_9APHY|nr:hypothetical protein EIP91_011276 [Steccherinum ochraceum]
MSAIGQSVKTSPRRSQPPKRPLTLSPPHDASAASIWKAGHPIPQDKVQVPLGLTLERDFASKRHAVRRKPVPDLDWIVITSDPSQEAISSIPLKLVSTSAEPTDSVVDVESRLSRSTSLTPDASAGSTVAAADGPQDTPFTSDNSETFRFVVTPPPNAAEQDEEILEVRVPDASAGCMEEVEPGELETTLESRGLSPAVNSVEDVDMPDWEDPVDNDTLMDDVVMDEIDEDIVMVFEDDASYYPSPPPVYSGLFSSIAAQHHTSPKVIVQPLSEQTSPSHPGLPYALSESQYRWSSDQTFVEESSKNTEHAAFSRTLPSYTSVSSQPPPYSNAERPPAQGSEVTSTNASVVVGNSEQAAAPPAPEISSPDVSNTFATLSITEPVSREDPPVPTPASLQSLAPTPTQSTATASGSALEGQELSSTAAVNLGDDYEGFGTFVETGTSFAPLPNPLVLLQFEAHLPSPVVAESSTPILSPTPAPVPTVQLHAPAPKRPASRPILTPPTAPEPAVHTAPPRAPTRRRTVGLPDLTESDHSVRTTRHHNTRNRILERAHSTSLFAKLRARRRHPRLDEVVEEKPERLNSPPPSWAEIHERNRALLAVGRPVTPANHQRRVLEQEAFLYGASSGLFPLTSALTRQLRRRSSPKANSTGVSGHSTNALGLHVVAH